MSAREARMQSRRRWWASVRGNVACGALVAAGAVSPWVVGMLVLR